MRANGIIQAKDDKARTEAEAGGNATVVADGQMLDMRDSQLLAGKAL